MRDDRQPNSADLPGNAIKAESEQAAKIDLLERTLADEREHSASLRSQVNEFRFQIEILEKSYSKQLEDARQRAVDAEANAEELKARVAQLNSAREDAIALLTEAKAEIDRLSSYNNQLDRHAATRDGLHIDGADEQTADGTINTLLDDAKWARDKKPDEDDRLRAEAEARAAEKAAAEEMISPELVFTAE
jgi:DNA repair exonuclease SbcCD ATPase subunit